MARPSKTRKTRQGKGKVLDVRSPKHVKMFENLIVNGPLTIVFVKAKWCGACHRFNDEVWNSLTKLKNRNVNLASVDSEVIGQTSLASVPRKFYPTLLLVGKDKKPATFLDEDGSPTNSMPRNGSLEEDREALSALVQNAPASMNIPKSVIPSTVGNLKPTMTPVGMPSEQRVEGSLTRSPFTSVESPMPSSIPIIPTVATSIPVGITPPDIGSDLIRSQTRSSTGTAGVIEGESMRGGGLLKAIRNQTASLRAMMTLRAPPTRRRKTVKR